MDDGERNKEGTNIDEEVEDIQITINN